MIISYSRKQGKECILIVEDCKETGNSLISKAFYFTDRLDPNRLAKTPKSMTASYRFSTENKDVILRDNDTYSDDCFIAIDENDILRAIDLLERGEITFDKSVESNDLEAFLNIPKENLADCRVQALALATFDLGVESEDGLSWLECFS